MENMFDVYKHVISLFPCQELKLALYLEDLSEASIKTFFANITEVPEDFRHEKAFAFKTMDYKNAMWVKIEDLYTLKNSQDVTLGKNNFDNSDINMLIHHWLSSDYDMFEYLSIEIKENVFLIQDLVLEDVLYLESTRFGGPVYFFKAKFTENRSNIIAYVFWRDSKFYMKTWTLDEIFGGKEPRTFRKEYDVLEILNRFEESKEELKSIVEEKQVENDMELQEVTAKKIKLTAEIDGLEKQLTEYEVYFETGIAKIDK